MKLSIIMPTRNRAVELHQTLIEMNKLRVEDNEVEFIIIDNGSKDGTKNVIEEFKTRLNVYYLYEGKPGKNVALNSALENCQFGEVVVFTDDDVRPETNWVVEIANACKRWPNHSVFGGRINPILPDGYAPHWVSDPFIKSFAFSAHHIAESECIYYRKGQTPFGPNYWLRKIILDKGYRFDERIGPGKGTMGDETAFLLDIMDDGYQIVYIPNAVVGHRIQPGLVKLKNIYHRAFAFGRSLPYLYGIKNPSLYQRNIRYWEIYSIFAMFWNMFKIVITVLTENKDKRIPLITKQIAHVANHYEALFSLRKK